MFDQLEQQIHPSLPWGIGIAKSVEGKNASKSISLLVDHSSFRHFQTCSKLKWNFAPRWSLGADLVTEGCSFQRENQKSKCERRNNAHLEVAALDGDARIEAFLSCGPLLNDLFAKNALDKIQFSYLCRPFSNGKLFFEACSADRMIRIGGLRGFELAYGRSLLQLASQISFSEAKRNGTVNFSLLFEHSDWIKAGMKINPIFGHYDFYQSLGAKGQFAAHLYYNPFSLESETLGSFLVPWVHNGTARISIGTSSGGGDWLSLGAWLEKAVMMRSDDNPVALSLGIRVSNLSKVKFGVFVDC